MLKSQVISADSSVKSTGLWEVYSGLVLLSALLFRPHNLPVLVFCLLIQTMMTKYIWRPLKFDAAQITIMHYWFGQAFFYFQVSWMLSLLMGLGGGMLFKRNVSGVWSANWVTEWERSLSYYYELLELLCF